MPASMNTSTSLSAMKAAANGVGRRRISSNAKKIPSGSSNGRPNLGTSSHFKISSSSSLLWVTACGLSVLAGASSFSPIPTSDTRLSLTNTNNARSNLLQRPPSSTPHTQTQTQRPTLLAASPDSSTPSISNEGDTTTTVYEQPFDERALADDHYNGITLNLAETNPMTETEFSKTLQQALQIWKAEGRKGIWIQIPKTHSQFVPVCMTLGFDYHFIKDGVLVVSQWLPANSASRLPHGPTHQLGVGTIVLKPDDPRKMLVVKEQTGPAAAYGLWKMPTGLLDPGEDVPDAALRELKEETGLDAAFTGIICFRQAHSPNRSSDMFFVCQLHLNDPLQEWSIQPEEIADIQWMDVQEFCDQEIWQGSEVYSTLNGSILRLSQAAVQLAQAKEEDGGNTNTNTLPTGMIRYDKLPVGLGRDGTNALFRSQL